MFFSKILYPVAAILSVAATAFASPVAAPAELATRATDTVLTDLKAFQSSVTPTINAFAGTSAEIDVLASVFADITAKIKVDVFVSADVDVVLDVAVDIIVSLVAKLNIFVDIDLDVSVQIDAFISAFVGALDAKHSGLGKSIGAAIPVADLNVFVLLDLVLSVKVLVLIDILGIIIL